MKQSPLRTAMAGLIGNVLEWFDFAAYGYFSTEIGKQFFPSTNATAQQLLALAVFAIGFAARPIGSIVLGLVGDRIGRRALLTVSIALMGGATLAIGVLPTYDTIGIAAPILLIVLRCVQGFSLGGEFTGSMVYTTELASPLMRGLIASSTAAGTTLGFILGSATAWLVKDTIGDADYAWRIPFIASITFCIIGWFLRKGIEESDHVKADRPPLLKSLASDWPALVQTFGIVAMTNAAYYLAFTFVVDRRKTGIDGSDFLRANTISLFVVLAAKPLGGFLSDRVGRRRLMIALTCVVMAEIKWVLPLMMTGSSTEFMLGQFALGVPLGMALGLQGAMVVEIFPMRTRVTSMSLAYSITLALSGGIAPLVSKWLVDEKHVALGPAYFVMIYGAIGLALMFPMRETNGRSLDE